MDKDSGIRYQLPFSLFGIGRKACVLREDIIDFCNMREVKTLTLVFGFSVGHNTQEVRARNLCSRLMASKPNQLIDTRTSYSQLELDEVRMELADFLGGHM
uniref:Uncharacterized protein n=1 Tax=Cucumis melo TaxID=3656 RepID=A0A9I9E7P9_CUCME